MPRLGSASCKNWKGDNVKRQPCMAYYGGLRGCFQVCMQEQLLHLLPLACLCPIPAQTTGTTAVSSSSELTKSP